MKIMKELFFYQLVLFALNFFIFANNIPLSQLSVRLERQCFSYKSSRNVSTDIIKSFFQISCLTFKNVLVLFTSLLLI